MHANPLSVVIVHEALGPDSRPDESDVMNQVQQVAGAIRKLGWQVSVLPTGLDLATTLNAIRSLNPDCVFNLVEALNGDGRLLHLLPAALEVAGIPYTGASADAIYQTSHKLLAKKLMQANDVATPDFLFDHRDVEDGTATWIVKSLWEHASLGMDDTCVVTGTDAAFARMDESTMEFGGRWFAERFVDGREFNISVVEQNDQPLVLPVAEMTFVDYPADKPRIVGYAAKWDEKSMEYSATQRDFPDLTDAERINLTRIAMRCWQIFDLAGYARVDIRLDAEGKPWVLEINANPCLAKDAGFFAAAREAGIDFENLIKHVVQAAVRPALRTYRRSA